MDNLLVTFSAELNEHIFSCINLFVAHFGIGVPAAVERVALILRARSAARESVRRIQDAAVFAGVVLTLSRMQTQAASKTVHAHATD